MKTYQQLEQENERLKNQELQGIRVTLNEMLTDDQQKTWGLENAGHKRNVQHIFMRTCLAIGELEQENERLKENLNILSLAIIENCKLCKKIWCSNCPTYKHLTKAKKDTNTNGQNENNLQTDHLPLCSKLQPAQDNRETT